MDAMLVLDSYSELSRANVDTEIGSVTRYTVSIREETRNRATSDLESREQLVGHIAVKEALDCFFQHPSI